MSLLPCHIINQVKHDKTTGMLDNAYAMFLDISGFTSITESLIKHDEEGIEAISDILNALFSPVIGIINKHNGFIAQFAGDAITAIFPNSNIDSIVHCADSILIFTHKLSVETNVGTFTTDAKIGIARGAVQWGICGYEYKAYYYRGNAIDWAAKAESFANVNEIVLKASKQPDSNVFACTCKEQHIYKIELLDKASIHNTSMGFCHDNRIENMFYPLGNMPQKYSGEFRNVISVFLALPEFEYDMMNVTIGHILSMLNQWGGYISSVDFGDKGAKAVIFFGMPCSYENNVKRSLGFLLDMRNEFGESVKAGISYGKCYSGLIGDNNRSTYTAIGDRVNTAARLMGIADNGQILTDSNVYKQMQNNFEIEYAGKKQLKGKILNEDVYILGERKKQDEAELQTAFTGRQKESAQLSDLIEKLTLSEKGGIISVMAEPGQGKTRLIEYVLNSMKTDKNIMRMKAEDIIKKSYNSVIDMLEHTLKLPDDIGSRREIFRNNYIRMTESLSDEEHAEGKRYESVLAALLNIFWEGSLYEKLDSDEIEQMTHQSIALFFKLSGAGSMPIIFMDDFQWIDTDTEKFIHYLMEESQVSICLIAGCRTGDKERLEHIKCLQHNIELKAMSASDTGQIAKYILGNDVSAAFVRFVHERSGGNPFYTEQFVKYLSENNMLLQGKNGLGVNSNIKGIPLKLGSVISSRIDNLNTCLKRAVFAASVLGSEFRGDYVRSMLTNIYSITSNEAGTSINAGISKNIWQISSELKYLFTHILLRDTAYGMMLKKDLRNLHLRAANIIMGISSDDKRMYPDIAYHFEQSASYEDAYLYYDKAGDYYELLYNYEEAIKYYRKCIEIAASRFDKGDDRLAHAYLNCGMAVKETGLYKDALELLNQAADLLKGKRKASKEREESLNIIGACYWNLGEYEKALSFHRKAMRKCRTLMGEYHKETAATYNDIGMVYWSWGKFRYAYNNIMRGLEIRKSISEGDDEDVADSYNSLGTLFLHMSRYRESLDYHLKSIEILENTLGHEHHKTAIGYNNIGVTYFYLHDYDKAIIALNKSLEIFEKLYSEKHPSTALAISNIGGLYNKTGNLRKAEEYIRRSLNLFMAIYGKKHPNVAVSYNNLAKLMHNLGRSDEALENHRAALKIRIEMLGEEHYDTGLSFREMGYCLTDKGDYKAAEKYFKQAMGIFKKIGGATHMDTGLTANAYARLLIKQKRKEDAIRMLNIAYKSFIANDDKEGILTIRERMNKIKEEA